MTSFQLKLFLLVFAVIVVVAGLTVILYYKPDTYDSSAISYKPGVHPEVDRVLNQAKVVYKQAKDLGTDFSSGPCLTNALSPDWVLDIAHNPRQEVDNLPQNQCSAFREGKAHHFVELDPQGNLIRVK